VGQFFTHSKVPECAWAGQGKGQDMKENHKCSDYVNCIELGANFVISNYRRLCAWFCKSAQKEQKFDEQLWALFGRVRGL
jgi:uncharacterized protein YodC (DUF2158 family)